MKNFGYQAEKFRSAVCTLMIPHPRGEAEAIAAAFQECRLAFQDLDRDDLDESAKEWAQVLEAYMGVDEGAEGLYGRWLAKAEGFTVEQKRELSECVLELNAWFHMYFWSTNEDA
jgi:hypothetical protein